MVKRLGGSVVVAVLLLIGLTHLATSQITQSGQTVQGPLVVYGAGYFNGAGVCVNPIGTTGGNAAGGICANANNSTLSFGGSLGLSSQGTVIATLGPGVEVGTPTGGMPPFGTINAQQVLVNNVPVLTGGSASVPAQMIDIPTGQVSYTLSTLSVARTSLLWQSTTAGIKTTSIVGCTAAYNGWDVDVKDDANTASTPGSNIIIQVLSGTIEHQITASITTSGTNVKLRCDGANQNWIIR